jgi:hypothetical protein
MNLSILAAAAPSLHRFLNELHSGKGFATALPASSYELSQNSGKGGSKTWGKLRSAVKKQSASNISGREKTFDDDLPGRPEFRPDTNRNAHTISRAEANRREAGSDRSVDGSEDMIIRQTKEYAVTYDDTVRPLDRNGYQPHAR